MVDIADFIKVLFQFAILSKLSLSISWANSIQFDDIVLIGPDLGLIINQSNFWTWNILQGRVNQVSQVLSSEFVFDNSVEFVWVPYIKHHNQTEENFELDYGKVCVRSNNSNFLLYVSYHQTSNSLTVKKSTFSDCNRYILINNDSICSLTVILPIIQYNLNLLNRYSSTFLVGHNKYSYIIFDRKYEYIDRNRLIIISYRFNYNNKFTSLNRPGCIDSFKNFIKLKTVTAKILTDLKTIVPLSNGDVYIFFDNHYCLTNITNYLDCQKKALNELFDLSLRNEVLATDTESTDSSTKMVSKKLFDQNVDRQTNPTTINEYRSAIMIIIVFIISILVIASYKLILLNNNNNH